MAVSLEGKHFIHISLFADISLTIFGSPGIWADSLGPASQWKFWKSDIRSSVFNKYLVNKPLSVASISGDNVQGRKIVWKMNSWLRSGASRATFCYISIVCDSVCTESCKQGTLGTTTLDLRSEDYESKTHKPLVQNPCCYPSHRCFRVDTQFTNRGLTPKWSHKDGRRNFFSFRKWNNRSSIQSLL